MKKQMNYLQIAKYLLKLEQKAYKKCENQKVEVKDKSAHDLVTNFDTSLEKYLISQLTKDFPGIKIVSEEFNTKVKAEGTYFVIDPIDGTINFANRIYDAWGIQMAYIENDVTVASAILLPSISDYYSAKGFGAYKNGEKFVTTPKDPAHSLIAIDTKNVEEYGAFMKELAPKILKFRHLGASCIHSTLLAEGKLGGYLQYFGHPWDVLPGFLLMDEAGCLSKKIEHIVVYATSPETLEILTKAVSKILKAEKSTKTQSKDTKTQKIKN